VNNTAFAVGVNAMGKQTACCIGLEHYTRILTHFVVCCWEGTISKRHNLSCIGGEAGGLTEMVDRKELAVGLGDDRTQ
jgi:hypothetical protein